MATVEFSNLGHSGLKVPALWLGTMMFGDQTDEAEARNIVDATRDAGLNAIDTADNYASGESERMVGRLIAKDRDRWILATKVANPIGKEPNDRGLSRRWLLKEVDNSLQRLQTDWIDVYYMHRDDESTPIEEVLSTFARLIESGKIKLGQTAADGRQPATQAVQPAASTGAAPGKAAWPAKPAGWSNWRPKLATNAALSSADT